MICSGFGSSRSCQGVHPSAQKVRCFKPKLEVYGRCFFFFSTYAHWWLNQPVWQNMCIRQIGSFPQGSGWTLKILKNIWSFITKVWWFSASGCSVSGAVVMKWRGFWVWSSLLDTKSCTPLICRIYKTVVKTPKNCRDLVILFSIYIHILRFYLFSG